MKEIKIKRWFEEKAQREAGHFNTYIDLKRNEDGTIEEINGYVTAYIEEQLAESEKAIKVRLASGEVLGNYKGWELWVPKSVIA